MLTLKLTDNTTRKLAYLARSGIGVDKATMLAGSYAARKLNTGIARSIRAKRALKLRTIRAGIARDYRTHGKPSAMHWRVTVSGEAMQISASSFSLKQIPDGVMFKLKNTGWSVIKGGFTARMKTGHVGAFMRDARKPSRRVEYNGASGRNNKQLPIRSLYTTGLSAALSDMDVARINDSAGNDYAREFLRLLRY